MPTSFGQVIAVTGPGIGYPGNFSRTVDTIVVAHEVLTTTATSLSFGQGAVIVPSTSGGSYQSFADYLGTITNVATLQQYFAGIAIRNVKVLQPYSAYAQGNATTATTTATQATVGSSTITVASATGVVVGQSVEGYGLAANTIVTGVSGTTITVSPVTTGVLSTTNVVFTSPVSPSIGSYAPGTMGEVLVRSSVTVNITAGTPQAAYPVYVRTVANANTPGTSVGDLEGANEVGTATPTIGVTAGSTTLTVNSGTGIVAGQQIVAAGIGPNTYIVSGATTSWVMSQPALYTISSGGAASFNNTGLLGSTDNPFMRFRTGVLDTNNVAEIYIPNRHAA